jgi:hypothetical protein
MSKADLEALIDRWTNEPDFREKMQRDPEGTVREAGLDLDSEELAALRAVNWRASDQELQPLLSKMFL